MLASDIILRAKQVSDIVNSDFYTYLDSIGSINESFRDIYNQLIEANDDFFLIESILAPVGTGNPNEYKIPLPDGCYKVRYVDYYGGSRWVRMDRFAMSMKNDTNSGPRYRIVNNDLWIVGILPVGGQIRLGYYPEPPRITIPDESIGFASSVPEYSLSTIGRGAWIDSVGIAVYPDSVGIKADNTRTGVTSTLLTLAGVSKVYYYRGYIYLLQSGQVWRAPTDLTSTIVPVSIVSATVTDFVIYNGVLYYSKGGVTYSAALDGTGAVSVLASASVDYTPGSWIAGGTMWVDGVDTGLPAQALIHGGRLLRFNSGTVYDDAGAVVMSLVQSVGAQVSGDRVLMVTDSAFAWSIVEDTDLTYPANAVWELMSYQVAMDIMRKAKQDYTQVRDRAMALLNRFMTQIKRDEGQPERINNQYSAMNGWF